MDKWSVALPVLMIILLISYAGYLYWGLNLVALSIACLLVTLLVIIVEILVHIEN